MEDLSTLLAAVKPKERSDQFKILAAIYCLGGVSKSITATIQELLKLHLRSKVPANLPARLRDYSAYVRIAEKVQRCDGC